MFKYLIPFLGLTATYLVGVLLSGGNFSLSNWGEFVQTWCLGWATIWTVMGIEVGIALDKTK
jgi:hypothetical protein